MSDNEWMDDKRDEGEDLVKGEREREGEGGGEREREKEREG